MATYGFAQCVFDRSALSEDEDVAVITSHYRRVDNNLPDVFPMQPFVDDDYAVDWFNWWNDMRAFISSKLVFKEVREYHVPDAPGGHLGDPVKIHPIGTAGSSTTDALPPQIAMSVTFKTAHRLRWGRFYVPGLTVSHITDEGRWDNGLITGALAATHRLTSRASTGASLTVFSKKYWNHEDPQLIQIDDIPDVIRRRRFSHAIQKSTATAG